VGVARGDIWYALVPEGGRVWYWSKEEMEVLVASGRVVLHPLPLPPSVPPSLPPPGSSPSVAMFFALLGSNSSSSSSSSLPSSSSFQAAREGWTEGLMEDLVQVITRTTSRLGLPTATHLPLPSLLHALEEEGREGGREGLGGYVRKYGVGPVLVWFAAVLWLNEKMERALPLIDLGGGAGGGEGRREGGVITTEYDSECIGGGGGRGGGGGGGGLGGVGGGGGGPAVFMCGRVGVGVEGVLGVSVGVCGFVLGGG